MGKGDKRTRRGKLFTGSHGNTRSRKTNRSVRPKKRR
ncbi:MAG TPA: 30S ribosomal protein THX [Burkholderiales bacterium]|jgi:ribosomal small subunit protein bTHX|nr:30S ribosomal protein THX [Burkholderiales bacterium]